MNAADRAIAEEQPYITSLYERLDELRARVTERLTSQLRSRGSTHREVWERDAFVARDVDRLARLDAVEPGLCFGRLDMVDHTRHYIGRVALSDEDYEPLLVDWRAPAAAPFYRATPANPGDVARRRHIRTSRRRVLAVDDEVLGSGLDDAGEVHLSGEAALLASLERSRTGRMGDIVATIQAEQDKVIRSPLNGVLVVSGGPGTGKTVAALHRAAYLLYTHRDRLEDRGVLVIGPNATFLRYIEQVLPSLGETGVVLTTLGSMVSGVHATVDAPEHVAVVKGDARMADVIANAVRDRQQVPDEFVDVTIDGTTLRLARSVCVDARAKARRSRRAHNAARPVFEREILTVLANDRAAAEGEVLDDEDLPEARDALAAEEPVAKVLDTLWPVLTPQQLLTDLFTTPGRIADAASHLPGEFRAALVNHDQRLDEWTLSDVPLLDEAAELLGDAPGDDAALRMAAAQRAAEEAYATDLLEHLDLGIPVDAAAVAERYRGPTGRSSTAERAAADRNWAYGHVIVDEAQELSPMAWRMVVRRCPTKSMTLVGDVAQTGAAAGATSWAEAIEPHVPGRWRHEELTINYRTPAEIMAPAAGVLERIDPALKPPHSVRKTGTSPWAKHAPTLAELAPLVRDEIDQTGDGKLAVIVPPERAAEITSSLLQSGCPVASGADPKALDSPATVLTVTQAKGLEFDSVIVVEPAEIVAGSAWGWRHLYVALTRATARLGIVYTADNPAPIGSA
ncbi:MAG TPA: ATP-binding domain-containing protein [Jiangellaceae bacterium]